MNFKTNIENYSSKVELKQAIRSVLSLPVDFSSIDMHRAWKKLDNNCPSQAFCFSVLFQDLRILKQHIEIYNPVLEQLGIVAERNLAPPAAVITINPRRKPTKINQKSHITKFISYFLDQAGKSWADLEQAINFPANELYGTMRFDEGLSAEYKKQILTYLKATASAEDWQEYETALSEKLTGLRSEPKRKSEASAFSAVRSAVRVDIVEPTSQTPKAKLDGELSQVPEEAQRQLLALFIVHVFSRWLPYFDQQQGNTSVFERSSLFLAMSEESQQLLRALLGHGLHLHLLNAAKNTDHPRLLNCWEELINTQATLKPERELLIGTTEIPLYADFPTAKRQLLALAANTVQQQLGMERCLQMAGAELTSSIGLSAEATHLIEVISRAPTQEKLLATPEDKGHLPDGNGLESLMAEISSLMRPGSNLFPKAQSAAAPL